MRVVISGTDTNVREGCTIKQLIEEQNFSTDAVAVAVNESFVPRSQHETTEVKEGDRVEVVSPMQGG